MAAHLTHGPLSPVTRSIVVPLLDLYLYLYQTYICTSVRPIYVPLLGLYMYLCKIYICTCVRPIFVPLLDLYLYLCWAYICTCVRPIFLPVLGLYLYLRQAYLYGCSFDTWSREPRDQSYVYTLLILAYILPLATIVYCYIKIYFYTRYTPHLIKCLKVFQFGTQLNFVFFSRQIEL